MADAKKQHGGGSGHGHGGHSHEEHGGEAHHGHHGHFGNPEDFRDYIARIEAPDRAEWQKPDEVVRALGLAPGQTASDIGAGPGYFSLRFARAVGEAGHVFAVDVEPQMLELLRERVAASGLRNLTPVLALQDDPLLPRASCDVILIINTYHHFPDGPAYLRKAARALKPGGRLANIDFEARDLPVGPPLEHKIPRERFVQEAAAAGLEVVAEPALLPWQYFVVTRRR